MTPQGLGAPLALGTIVSSLPRAMSEEALSSSPPLRQAWVYVLMGAEVQERELDTQPSLSQPALQVFSPSEVRLFPRAISLHDK